MIYIKTNDTYAQMPVFSQRKFPAAPFPRKYVYSVFDACQDALQAFQTLQDAGYDINDIYLMSSRDYVVAVEERQTLVGFLFSIDFDGYLNEVRRGCHILVMHLSSYEKMKQVRDLLAPHHAHHMKYIDTWTVTELLP